MSQSVHLRALLGMACCASALLACSNGYQPKPDPNFSAVRPAAVQPLPIADGAIYRAGHEVSLFDDRRARRVGDIITVVLLESTNASKKAGTSTKKTGDINLADPTLFGTNVTRNGAPILSASVSTDRSFKGEGDSSQSNSLTGRVSVTVTEVLANGNMMVRGEKLIALNEGAEHIRLSGIVRPDDVRADNTVLSTQVADAQIIYGGQGTIAEANSKGWMQRFFDSPLWPF